MGNIFTKVRESVSSGLDSIHNISSGIERKIFGALQKISSPRGTRTAMNNMVRMGLITGFTGAALMSCVEGDNTKPNEPKEPVVSAVGVEKDESKESVESKLELLAFSFMDNQFYARLGFEESASVTAELTFKDSSGKALAPARTFVLTPGNDEVLILQDQIPEAAEIGELSAHNPETDETETWPVPKDNVEPDEIPPGVFETP